jgi:hypothetical protein
VVADLVANLNTYTADVGVRNLMSYSIGDEQTGAAPADTMGVFVFFSSDPVVARPVPCAGCFARIRNYQGTGTFTAASQKYFYWPERLAAYGAAGDTTRSRRTWVFEASPGVQRFTFDVLVSAAWPAPYETRWKVQYNGDSIPDTNEEPRWRRQVVGTGTSAAQSATPGVLATSAPKATSIRFYRRDSIAAGGSAYVETLLNISTGKDVPAARLAIDDGAKFIALGMAQTSAWFVDSSGTFLAGTRYSVNTTAGYHTYQLRKYGADSAVFYVDGVRGGALPRASFPATAYGGTAPLVDFESRGLNGPVGGNWDYVIYEIGTPYP